MKSHPTSAPPRGQGGFTLIELLMVVSIIAVLSGVVVFAIGRAQENAERNACHHEKVTFQVASDVASVEEGDDIRSYLKTEQGVYFQVSGSSFVAVAGSGYTADCEPT